MTQTSTPATDAAVEQAVLQTLAYFDIFSYPLTREELLQYSSEPAANQQTVDEALQQLTRQGLAFSFGPFFQLKNEPLWAAQRLGCNRRADEFLPIAQRMARFIGKFPFVRGVFVSGSLSKHCMRPDSDVDFFIVTAPDRLWLARILLVLYKKIFLLNSHKIFCINYFVDNEHLEIEEKNLFTATETVTLLPMWGREYYDRFCQTNAWAWKHYPHLAPRPIAEVPPHTKGWFKSALESSFSGPLGHWLDRKAMRITVGFWKRKFRHLDHSTFDLALKSRRGVSKHHPLHFQQKVLESFERNLQQLKNAP